MKSSTTCKYENIEGEITLLNSVLNNLYEKELKNEANRRKELQKTYGIKNSSNPFESPKNWHKYSSIIDQELKKEYKRTKNTYETPNYIFTFTIKADAGDSYSHVLGTVEVQFK